MGRKKTRYGDDRYNALALYGLADEADGYTGENPEANERYMRSAQMGYAPAQYRVGELINDGKIEGTAADAEKWFRKAIRQGYIEAMWELGRAYEHGGKIKQNSARAFLLYAKAICAAKEAPEPEFGLGPQGLTHYVLNSFASLLSKVWGCKKAGKDMTRLEWPDGSSARINLFAMASSVRGDTQRKKPDIEG